MYEELIKIEQGNSKKVPETLVSLGKDRAHTVTAYIHMISNFGEEAKAQKLLDQAIKKYPKERDFLNMARLFLFSLNKNFNKAIKAAEHMSDSGTIFDNCVLLNKALSYKNMDMTNEALTSYEELAFRLGNNK